MIQVVYDSNGEKLGAYEGDSDFCQVYDMNGNYIGKWSGHEIFYKDGNSLGYFYGYIEEAVKKLVVYSMLH